MKPLVSRDATASLTVAWVRSNSLASWLTRRRSTSWKSRYIKNWAWMGLRSCSHASSRSRTRKTCESLSSAATILASTSSCCAPRSKTNPKLEVSVLDVGIAPQRHLEDHGLEPRLVHLVHVLRAMSLFSQERLDGGRDRRDERPRSAARCDPASRKPHRFCSSCPWCGATLSPAGSRATPGRRDAGKCRVSTAQTSGAPARDTPYPAGPPHPKSN